MFFLNGFKLLEDLSLSFLFDIGLINLCCQFLKLFRLSFVFSFFFFQYSFISIELNSCKFLLLNQNLDLFLMPFLELPIIFTAWILHGAVVHFIINNTPSFINFLKDFSFFLNHRMIMSDEISPLLPFCPNNIPMQKSLVSYKTSLQKFGFLIIHH